MPIKLVALDIDGTLLDTHGDLPPENGCAISEAVERGVQVILVSGRRWCMARRVSVSLGLTLPVIAHNGALIRSPIDSSRLARCFLEPELAARILARSKDYLRYVVLHRDQGADGQTLVHPACRQNLLMQSYLGQFPDAVLQTESLLQGVDSELIQIMFGGELAAMMEIEHLLQAAGLLENVKLAKTHYPQRNLGIIDLLDKGCSKRAALEFLAAFYGVSREEVLAIGDNHNDLEMLEYAGIGVVVANCVAELKGRGFEETASNNAGGVAQALRRYLG
ncbi:MAG: HAD-IIB family hydrolase [Acidobacteria bacterium]|nr:HAD-IIB family hydrolase [Acidobacteriota bacterium]